jgi:hypothetical protein
MTIKTNFLGVDVVVEGQYQPEEKQTWDHPGSADDFFIEKVTTTKGDEITEMFDADLFRVRFERRDGEIIKTVGASIMDILTEACLEKIHDMDDNDY